MKSLIKWIGIILAGVVVLLLIFAGYVYFKSASMLSKTYTHIQGKNIYVPNDSASVERGRHLAEVVGGCSACHGRDLGGQQIDAMPFAAMNIPNITFGNGGLPTNYTVSDLDLAIRHGVKHDKTGMMMMPAYHMNRVADEDIAALYAYLKVARKVNKTIPPYELGPIGKMVLTIGGVNLQPNITNHKFKSARPEIAPTVEYGKYVAEISCMGCHGPNYSGGEMFEGDPTWPPPANLTKVLKQYTAESFVAFMKTGMRPNGTMIDTRPMPTDIMREFNETDVTALWAYLGSLAPQEDGSQTWPQVLGIE